MRFKLLLKIVKFFEHFWNFSQMYLFLYPIYFSKNFLQKLRERISLLDKLEQIWCWSPFEILKENWRWCKFVLSSAPVSYFGHYFLIKFPIGYGLIFFERKFIYKFYRNRENQISTFSRPKMRFKLLLKIITFFKHILIFFTGCICFSIQFIFQKSFFWSKGKV